MNDTLKILKCVDCGDRLTPGEERFYLNYQFGHGMKPRCFQCNKAAYEKIVEKNKKKLTVEERIDQIQDQQFRWGEPRR